MKIGIITFLVRRRSYRFKEPLILDSGTVDGQLCLSHEELNLYACGSSWGDCEATIRAQLSELWEDYALAPDEELTMGAMDLKEKLLGMVE